MHFFEQKEPRTKLTRMYQTPFSEAVFQKIATYASEQFASLKQEKAPKILLEDLVPSSEQVFDYMKESADSEGVLDEKKLQAMVNQVINFEINTVNIESSLSKKLTGGVGLCAASALKHSDIIEEYHHSQSLSF
jgi:hypothetical protein